MQHARGNLLRRTIFLRPRIEPSRAPQIALLTYPNGYLASVADMAHFVNRDAFCVVFTLLCLQK
jgi:hypothetical protein